MRERLIEHDDQQRLTLLALAAGLALAISIIAYRVVVVLA